MIVLATIFKPKCISLTMLVTQRKCADHVLIMEESITPVKQQKQSGSETVLS